MENRKLPALIAIAGIIIAVIVFFFVANDDTADQESETTQTAETSTTPEDTGDDKEDPDKEKPAEPEVPVIEIEGGQPVGGVAEFEVVEGDNIRFIVRSDEAHEIHLHTYDVAMEVEAGGEVEFDVPATIGGVVEAEIEDTAVPIAEISVVPG
ncbi:MAG: hypothetical protein QOI31_2937 [Solirubrobacterales bacterium]|jgi:hypothetical protein|nr:hypothetical protein [Solirubrobacterales bacterium]